MWPNFAQRIPCADCIYSHEGECRRHAPNRLGEWPNRPTDGGCGDGGFKYDPRERGQYGCYNCEFCVVYEPWKPDTDPRRLCTAAPPVPGVGFPVVIDKLLCRRFRIAQYQPGGHVITKADMDLIKMGVGE